MKFYKNTGSGNKEPVDLSSLAGMSGSIDKDSLGYKRKKAIVFLASKNWTKKQVAKECGISRRMLNKWLEKEAFQKELESTIERIAGVNKGFRLEQMKNVLPFLYDEVYKRAATGDLDDVGTPHIVKMIQILQNEMRLDTTGEVTQKVGHITMDKLGERYRKSQSAKTLRNIRKKKVANLDNYKQVKANADDTEEEEEY